MNRKERRSQKHAAKHTAQRHPIMALMMLPNEQIQAMILAGSSSSYVPTAQRTDNRPFAELERIRKGQNRRKQANV